MGKRFKDLKGMKIAITHDYLITFGGAELVLLELLEMFPQADLYTAVAWEEGFSGELWEKISKHEIKTSFINNLKWFRKFWKVFLPFHAMFFQKQNLDKYDFVISVSSGFAKWLNTNKPTKHLAYINTPPRFLWGMDSTMFYKLPRVIKLLLNPLLNAWKNKDLYYTKKADYVIGNSSNIRDKIKDIYDLEADVIYPPVNKPEIAISDNIKDYYLVINRLVAYKRIDSIVQAFNEIGKRLIIIGEGPERGHLESMARDNVTLTGFLSNAERNKYLAECKGFIYPGEEDFGISMVEAMFLGKPVIAYVKGGSRDILDDLSGVLYENHDTKSIISAIHKFETINFDREKIMTRADKFSDKTFKDRINGVINSLLFEK